MVTLQSLSEETTKRENIEIFTIDIDEVVQENDRRSNSGDEKQSLSIRPGDSMSGQGGLGHDLEALQEQ